MSEPCKYTNIELKYILIATCAGMFIMPLMSTMINLALVDIGEEFNKSTHSLAYLNTIFLLASAIVIIPLARFSDIHGRKKVFLYGIIVTAISALMAMLSPNFEFLIMARFVMGIGAAAAIVTSVAILTDVFPIEKRGWALGIYSTFIYVGIAIGPSLGGFICDTLGWRYIFLFMIPFALTSLVFISRFKKDIIASPNSIMDIRGSIIYGLTIFFTMFGIINLPNLWAFVMLAAGLTFLTMFIRHLKNFESPVLNINIFKYKMFSRSCIASFMNYAASFSVSFFFALYLQNIGALSAFQAGSILLIQPFIQVLLTAKAGSISDRIKNKRILPTAGMAFTSFGVFMMIFLGEDINMYQIVIILISLGIGFAMFSAPNMNIIMSSVPSVDRGEASGMVAVVRQIGMMTSMGITMLCMSVIMGSTDDLNPSTYGQFVEVIEVVFSICFVMCVVGTIFSWFSGDNSISKLKG